MFEKTKNRTKRNQPQPAPDIRQLFYPPLAIFSRNVHMMMESSMGGEDFAYYLERIPGAYFRIGSFDGKPRDIHTNDFDIDEQCMATAITVFVETIKQYYN